MRRTAVLVCTALFGLAGCAELGGTPSVSSPPTAWTAPGYTPAPPPQAGPGPIQPGVGQGDRLIVQLDQPIGAEVSRVGDRFQGHIAQAVLDPAGRELVPVGARVIGHVADLRPGTLTEPGAIALAFDELDVEGRAYPLAARVIGTDTNAPLHGVDWRYVVGGGVAGGVLGAIIGHRTGAIAGAALGAGAGTLISLGKSRAESRLPAGTALALELDQPIPGLQGRFATPPPYRGWGAY